MPIRIRVSGIFKGLKNVNKVLRVFPLQFVRFQIFYCANPKTVNTRIIFGILLCCKEKANQMQDGKTARLKMRVNTGVITIAASFGNRALMPSRPIALFAFKCFS